jgi:hypothetical protein
MKGDVIWLEAVIVGDGSGRELEIETELGIATILSCKVSKALPAAEVEKWREFYERNQREEGR